METVCVRVEILEFIEDGEVDQGPNLATFEPRLFGVKGPCNLPLYTDPQIHTKA